MVTTSGIVVMLERKEGNARENGGKFADSVKVHDEGTGMTSWFELGQHINGECPAEGERTALRIRLGRMKVQAVTKAGKTYDKYVDRNTVVGFVGAPVAL